MNTKVISIINFKGGVGKSTVTLNLGEQLSHNNKVLLIDFDGQGNLTRFAGREEEITIVDALDKIVERKTAINHPIQKINDNLDLIGCNISKESWMNKIVSEIARETILKRYIQILKRECNYDYILIDNAPSVNLDFQNALVASDSYIIVTEPELGSTDGIATVQNIIQQVKEFYNDDLKALGIIFNKVDERTNLHNMMQEHIRDGWNESIYIFETRLPRAIAVGESQLLAKPIGVYAPNSKIGKAFKQLADEFEIQVEKDK